ncbi:Sarcosine oxidase, gamma subunit [Fulvimarina pelagi HTCC2506]|uniref:Sarcosine oxidase, gamma subunit n=1 Tax=Fulvimarina pelagi HTCC2506 TaxID=314231 RepID=Q0G2T9_9HYPH|nr:sarcosine oxidase subunit gamma family protein [Fulvimarina pelagi]EAU42092.1 Sarcosine oxidase, gamma subunit [Fulvimarina pelagi HTCC2506]
MSEISVKAVHAFDGLITPVGETRPAGVVVSERTELALAAVLARKRRAGDLAALVANEFGCHLPAPARRTEGRDISVVSTGPGAWLACREAGGYGFAENLAETMQGVASVTDQSDAFAVLRLTGPRVRNVLAKGIHLDLDANVFLPGHAAVTQCGHVGVSLWRLDDLAGGDAAFEIAMFRSYAESFWHWLSVSAAVYGLAVAAGG